MKAAEVPDELVEAAARAVHAVDCCPLDENSQCYGEPLNAESTYARVALAAVLPLAQAEAWDKGWDAAVEQAPGDVWFDEWSYQTNPYGAARLRAAETERTS